MTLNIKLLTIYQKIRKAMMITASFPFLNKLTIEKNDFKDKINQFLLSWNTVAKEKE